jgi:hypothetical protein
LQREEFARDAALAQLVHNGMHADSVWNVLAALAPLAAQVVHAGGVVVQRVKIIGMRRRITLRVSFESSVEVFASRARAPAWMEHGQLAVAHLNANIQIAQTFFEQH